MRQCLPSPISLFLLRHRWESSDVEAVGAQMVVKQIDSAGFFHAGEELAHFIPPNRRQIVRIVPAELMIDLQTLVKTIGVGLSQAKPLGLIGLRLLLNLEAL